jgi:SAM-dependent methyltransferase
MAEIARVLRPGGVLALAWNTYDTSIPWVRRLERLLSPGTDDAGRTGALMESPYFGFVEEQQFRFWQVHTGSTLADLARSVSYVSTMKPSQRDAVLAKVDALYAEYGRGHDGMQLPWITRCYRAVVRHSELPPEVAPAPRSSADIAPPGLEEDASASPGAGPPTGIRRPPEDPGMQLIDFR